MAIKLLSLKMKREIVRKYLLEQGFYLNDGVKYGMDFLVYTDLPNKVHSKYGLIIHRKIKYQDLVSYQRVCSSNNKTLLIAFVSGAINTFKIRFATCERFVLSKHVQEKS